LQVLKTSLFESRPIGRPLFLHSFFICGKSNRGMNKEGSILTNIDEFPVANLKNDQLSKIEKLEQELRQETNENIVLIAYDERDEN
jgi:hypothetical protein